MNPGHYTRRRDNQQLQSVDGRWSLVVRGAVQELPFLPAAERLATSEGPRTATD